MPKIYIYFLFADVIETIPLKKGQVMKDLIRKGIYFITACATSQSGQLAPTHLVNFQENP
ncbi:hypothetical protein [Segetibacter koreensis]|uniref:hypothetical protein n=1 Tax=Segetibacter koreensis TaxID=398037 RepID=UPI00036C750D|nr:hypothetical protein [Segetibacter koreensis]